MTGEALSSEATSSGQTTPDGDQVTLTACGQSFVASRAALRKTSPYFRAMFESGMREASSAKIEMHDIEPETLSAFVDVSAERPIFITENNLPELLRSSLLFQFDQIMHACISHIYKTLSVHNALRVWQMGEAFSIPQLRRSALATLVWHFEEFVESPALLDCPIGQLKRIVEDDRLNVLGESPVYTAIERWARANVASCTQREFVDLLMCVRYNLLPKSERVDLISMKTPDGTAFVCHMPLEFQPERLSRRPLVSPAVIVSKCGPTDQLADDELGLFMEDNAAKGRFVLRTLLPARSRKPLQGFVVCAVGCAVYFLCGEFGLGSGNWHRDVWRWDYTASEWTHVGTIPAPRRHCKMAVVKDRIYLFGGYGRYRVPMTSVDFFDTSNG
ncbi:unnamed protein product, partial [Ixodes hexagonus]